MADTVSVTQAVLLRAFKLVDGIAGEINGVPNEPTDDMADDIAMDLAEAIGVPFDEHWPEAAAAALASTQPAPAFPREEVAKLIQAVERYAFKRGYEEGQDDAAAGVDDKSPSIAIFLCGMDVARECDAEEPGARLLALLQGKQP